MNTPKDISPARADGRPQYYDINEGDVAQCYECLKASHTEQYGRGMAVINDPGNSPEHDGGVYTLCLKHIPDNAVIHDPYTNVSRSKDGKNTWTQPDDKTGKQPPEFT